MRAKSGLTMTLNGRNGPKKSRPQPADDYSDYRPYDMRNGAQMYEDLRQEQGEFLRENDSVHDDVFDDRVNRFREKRPHHAVDPTKPLGKLYKLEDIPEIEILKISKSDLINIRKHKYIRNFSLDRIQINAQTVIDFVKNGLLSSGCIVELYNCIIRDLACWEYQPYVEQRNSWEKSLVFKTKINRRTGLTF